MIFYQSRVETVPLARTKMHINQFHLIEQQEKNRFNTRLMQVHAFYLYVILLADYL